MIRLEMENHNSILAEKQQAYKHYHQVKSIDMNNLYRRRNITFESKPNNRASQILVFSFRKNLGKTNTGTN